MIVFFTHVMPDKHILQITSFITPAVFFYFQHSESSRVCSAEKF